MIEEHFGFSAQPFKLSPDTKFFFSSSSHTKAMAYLHYGLRQAEGFIVITGEIGAGKSMLIGHMLDQINISSVSAAHIVTSSVEPEQLLSQVLSAFQIEASGTGRTAELEAFEDFLYDNVNRGRRVLLVVDEAQNLPSRTIEELRMLTNINHQGTPLFQVFLVGQPEFRETLGRSDMEQLRQRVIASYHLQSLNSEETREYIEHRLAVVGRVEKPYFTEEAFDIIYEKTDGVPRRINSLCTRLLLFCVLENRDLINSAVVRKVAEELAVEVSGVALVSANKPSTDENTTLTDGNMPSASEHASNVVAISPGLTVREGARKDMRNDTPQHDTPLNDTPLKKPANGSAHVNGVDPSPALAEKPAKQGAATLNDVASAIAELAREKTSAQTGVSPVKSANDEPKTMRPRREKPDARTLDAPTLDTPVLAAPDTPPKARVAPVKSQSGEAIVSVMDQIMALRGDLHSAHKGNREIYRSLSAMEDGHADNVVQIRQHLDRADTIIQDLKR